MFFTFRKLMVACPKNLTDNQTLLHPKSPLQNQKLLLVTRWISFSSDIFSPRKCGSLPLCRRGSTCFVTNSNVEKWFIYFRASGCVWGSTWRVYHVSIHVQSRRWHCSRAAHTILTGVVLTHLDTFNFLILSSEGLRAMGWEAQPGILLPSQEDQAPCRYSDADGWRSSCYCTQ
jgi:hypothetical protein